MKKLCVFAVAVAVSACGGSAMRVEVSGPTLRLPMTGETELTVVVHDAPQGKDIDVIADGLPEGVTVSTQTLKSNDSIQTITFVSARAKTGTSKVSLSFVAQGQKKTLSLDVEVIDSEAFALTLLPSTLVVRQGQSSTATCTVKNSAGRTASGSVSMLVEGTPPAGLQFTAGNVTLSGDAAASATLKVTSTSAVAVGTHPFKLSATLGSARAELPFQVLVIDARAPDFTLVAPAMLNVRRGGQSPIEIKVNALMGFDGMVAITAANLPAGVTADPPMVTATPGSPATLYLQAAATAMGGTAMVTLTGTSGQLVHQARVVLKVSDSGTLDGTFGTGGLANLPALDRSSTLSKLAVMDDGKILAGGMDGANCVIVRFTADGSVDTSFGTMGVATMMLTDVEGLSVMAITPSGTGAFVALSGYTFTATAYAYASVIAKLKDDGSLDTSFGTTGTWTDTQSAYPYQVIVLGDGSLVVAETLIDEQTYAMNAALVKLTAAGMVDMTFGTSGLVTLPDLYTLDVKEQADGSLVLFLGKVDANQQSIDPQLTRFTSTGQLDMTFGTMGTVVLDLGTAVEAGYGLSIKPNGSIVALALGYSDMQQLSDGKAVLFQLTAAGALDPAFATGGKVEVPGVFGLSMLTSADGSATVGGCTMTSSGYRARAFRVVNDGTVDASFSESNATGVPVGPTTDACVTTLGEQKPGGKLIVGGSLGQQLDEGWFISRLSP